jgi:flagellar hook-length control protein FliK
MMMQFEAMLGEPAAAGPRGPEPAAKRGQGAGDVPFAHVLRDLRGPRSEPQTDPLAGFAPQRSSAPEEDVEPSQLPERASRPEKPKDEAAPEGSELSVVPAADTVQETQPKGEGNPNQAAGESEAGQQVDQPVEQAALQGQQSQPVQPAQGQGSVEGPVTVQNGSEVLLVELFEPKSPRGAGANAGGAKPGAGGEADKADVSEPKARSTPEQPQPKPEQAAPAPRAAPPAPTGAAPGTDRAGRDQTADNDAGTPAQGKADVTQSGPRHVSVQRSDDGQGATSEVKPEARPANLPAGDAGSQTKPVQPQTHTEAGPIPRGELIKAEGAVRSEAGGAGPGEGGLTNLRSEIADGPKEAVKGEPVPQGHLVEHVVQVARASLGRGQWQVQLRLSPPELGSIRVHVNARQDALTMRMVAETPEARELISSRLGELRQALQQHGIRMERVDVEFRRPMADGWDNSANTGSRPWSGRSGGGAPGGQGFSFAWGETGQEWRSEERTPERRESEAGQLLVDVMA